MGTNYYLSKAGDESHCPTCVCHSKGLHIGKSSAGWAFALHVIPERGLYSLDDWKKLLEAPDAVIRSEYDCVVTLDMLLQTITDRVWPNGLLRHRIGNGCVGMVKELGIFVQESFHENLRRA